LVCVSNIPVTQNINVSSSMEWPKVSLICTLSILPNFNQTLSPHKKSENHAE
jgi:hypothetical protein